MARDAAEASRKLTLPQKVEDFKPALPQDFKPPQGVEFKINEQDPLMAQARSFALKHGLTQDGFSELLGLHAAGQIGSQQTVADAKAAEVQKLGVNGPARMTAANTWLKAVDPELGAQFSQYLFTAKQVEFVERLMARDRAQGTHSYTSGNREPPEPEGKVSQEQYSRMSAGERLDYARRFPQDQFQRSNGAAR